MTGCRIAHHADAGSDAMLLRSMHVCLLLYIVTVCVRGAALFGYCKSGLACPAQWYTNLIRPFDSRKTHCQATVN